MSADPTAASYDLPLFVPANKPERFAKAIEAAADAIIIDLEDAVAREDKANARRMLAAQKDLLSQADKAVFVRINAADTDFYNADVDLCAGLPLTGVVLPKAESAPQMHALRQASPGNRLCLALVETLAAFAVVDDIARAADRLIFGSIDFCADLGCEHERDALLVPRHQIVAAARRARRPAPIDGVTTALRDADQIQDDTAYAVRLGFGGKLLIHPAQVAAARRGLAPSQARVDWARAVVAADRGGAGVMRGAMIDAPVLAQARTILARASRLEEIQSCAS